MNNDLEIKNARIENASLGFEDHGILTAFLTLDYGNGGGQGFGGFTLDGIYCAEFIKKVLKIVGVEKWEELKGEYIRVKAEHVKIHAIGNILEDKWFNPSEEFRKMERKLSKNDEPF